MGTNMEIHRHTMKANPRYFMCDTFEFVFYKMMNLLKIYGAGATFFPPVAVTKATARAFTIAPV